MSSVKRFVKFVAAGAAVSLGAALALALSRPGAVGPVAWWLLGPASFVVAVAYTMWRKPSGRLRWLILAVTGLAWLVSVFFITLTQSGSTLAIGWLLLGPIPFLAAGIYLLWRNPDQRTGWWLTIMAATTLAFPSLLEAQIWITFRSDGVQPWMSWALAIESVVVMVGLVSLTLLVGLFPSGIARDSMERKVVQGLWIVPALMLPVLMTNEHIITDGVTYVGLDPVASPLYVESLGWMGSATAPLRVGLGAVVILGIVLLVRRYRGGQPTERRQIRWVLYGSAAAIAVGIFPFIVGPLVSSIDVGHSPLMALPSLGLLLIPASIVVAVDQPQWIDTDAVIRKSFVFGGLSIGIFLVYGAVAAGLGLAAGARLPVEAAIVVTAALAFLFQPTRARLQQLADRWVFGDRPTPFEAVAGFDEAMSDSYASGDVGRRLAELVRSAARVDWASVELPPDAPFDAGEVSGPTVMAVPIKRGGDDFGEIRCGPKVSGGFTEHDAEVISALAGQAALLIANVRLAGRIVHAQEAERRRIERNIHDGAQQELVALVAKLGLARSEAKQGNLDESILIELQKDTGTILRDLRDFAQGIHPSVLTDGGLVEALEDRCSRLPIEVDIESTPEIRHRRFTDDVEGAAYFFVAEGMANILKHASASAAWIGISQSNGDLELTLSDNGVGFELETTGLNGLAGLTDRFAALSGTVSVEAEPGAGTVLRARLPVGVS